MDEMVGEDSYEILSIKVEHIANEMDEDCQQTADVGNEFAEVTCPECKHINKIPQGMMTYTCLKCHKVVDRDIEEDGKDEGENGE
jgi:DNA-directed RNA polymerase subunit RPC12/RpoP